jgi:hypothetical protein
MAELPQKFSSKQLPILATIREAFEFSWQLRGVLWPWIFAIAVVTGLGDYYLELSIQNMESIVGIEEDLWNAFILPLLLWVPEVTAFILFAVLWHRRILLGKTNEMNFLNISLSKRELCFLKFVLLVYMSFTIMLIGVFVGVFLINMIWDNNVLVFNDETWESVIFQSFFLFLPFYFLLGRCSLVFPAVAVDLSPTLHWSWTLSRGNGWRLACLVGGLPLIYGLVAQWPYWEQEVMGISIVSTCFWAVLTPVEVAVVSIAFRELANWTPPAFHLKEAPVV